MHELEVAFVKEAVGLSGLYLHKTSYKRKKSVAVLQGLPPETLPGVFAESLTPIVPWTAGGIFILVPFTQVHTLVATLYLQSALPTDDPMSHKFPQSSVHLDLVSMADLGTS